MSFDNIQNTPMSKAQIAEYLQRIEARWPDGTPAGSTAPENSTATAGGPSGSDAASPGSSADAASNAGIDLADPAAGADLNAGAEPVVPRPKNAGLNLGYLTHLQAQHISHIPFENLDIMAGKPISLDRNDLFHKIITCRRGGVCSELNTLYNWLLESLGFDVTSYSARIIASTAPVQMRSHRIIGVHMQNGTFLSDVGFNFDHHRIPLQLEADLVQYDGECEYKLARDDFWGWLMWQHRPNLGWRRKLGFTEEPQIDLDFVAPTFFAANHPDSRINKATKVSVHRDGRFYAIRSGAFLTENGGEEEIIEKITSKEQELKLIREFFLLPV